MSDVLFALDNCDHFVAAKQPILYSESQTFEIVSVFIGIMVFHGPSLQGMLHSLLSLSLPLDPPLSHALPNYDHIQQPYSSQPTKETNEA